LKASDISAVKGCTAKQTTLGLFKLFPWGFQGLDTQEVGREAKAHNATKATAGTTDLRLLVTSCLEVSVPMSSLPQAMGCLKHRCEAPKIRGAFASDPSSKKRQVTMGC